MRWPLIAISLALAGCGGGGSPPPPPNYQPPISGWTPLFGSAGGVDFDFPPSPGSVQYVVSPGYAPKLGQTITLKFQISGSGTWGIQDPSDTLPPKVTLLLWERADNLSGQGVYEAYREYCTCRTEITNPGTYTVTETIDPAKWTGVFGQMPSPAAFQQLLNNLYAVGFTFGGNSFAGHGVYSASGKFHFTLNSYTVQ